MTFAAMQEKIKGMSIAELLDAQTAIHYSLNQQQSWALLHGNCLDKEVQWAAMLGEEIRRLLLASVQSPKMENP